MVYSNYPIENDDRWDNICDGCGCRPCDCDFEAMEAERDRKEKERLASLSAEDLGKEYIRQMNRHDSAVDRCEQINSPTIEDSAGWMKFIEKEFEKRGLQYFDYIGIED